MTPQIRPVKKELHLNYPIETIKQNVDLLCKKGKSFYKLRDRNDGFNTYRIDIQNGLKSCSILIALNKLDASNTVASFETYAQRGGVGADNKTLFTIQDSFLQNLSASLSGKPVTSRMISSSKVGCLGIILAMIVFIFLLQM